MIYGSETRSLLADVGLKFERPEMHIIRWMSGVSMRSWLKLSLTQLSLEVVGYDVMGCDEDVVKKCMEIRIEGRRPVGRPRRTWLDSVEADMAELEIDKEPNTYTCHTLHQHISQARHLY